MSASNTEPPQSPLDRAHAWRLAGESEQALRLAGSILVAAPEDPGAAALVAMLLAQHSPAAVGPELWARLVDAYVRRGDLPMACFCARTGLAGSDAEDAAIRIGDAFGKGSPRLGDVAPLPPPLPDVADIAPFFRDCAGDDLLAQAAKALQRHMQTEDAVASDRTLPRLPLFSELTPAFLATLLGTLEPRAVAAGAAVIHQGDEGREALLLARGIARVVRGGGDAPERPLATLGPGAIFGEMALVSRAPRAASVRVIGPALLLAISRDALESVAQVEPAIARELGGFCHRRMISNLIRHSPVLGAVDPSEREALVAQFEPRTFEAGELLVRQGEALGGLFLLASGGVSVRSRDDGEQVVLAELGPGEVVGEISVVLRRPASADVVASHETVALELSRERFLSVIREHPALLRELYETAVSRDEEARSVVAQPALDVDEVVLL